MEDEKRIRVLELCKEYLDNAWTEVALEDIECKQLTAGYGNQTYLCSIKECTNLSKYKDTKYKEAVIQVYGSELCDEKEAFKFNGGAGEAIVRYVLSQMGVTPKILGVFPGGIIAEYIPSRGSTPDDWKDLELCAAFARKLAKEHTADVPISRRLNFLDRLLNTATRMKSESRNGKPYTEEEIKEREELLAFPAQKEYDFFAGLIPRIQSKVVFSHCDLNNNNLLLKHEYNSVDERIMFVDYEVASYFYRGYDISLFLHMNCLAIDRVDNHVNITYDQSNTKTKEVVVDAYLKEKAKLLPNEVDQELDTVEHLTMEVEFFDILYRATMAVYAQVSIRESKNDFVISYAHNGIKDFTSRKEAFLRKYSKILT